MHQLPPLRRPSDDEDAEDGLMIRETYVNASENRMFGESEWFEPFTDDLATLFRDLQREYGGCISKMWQDVKVPRFGAAGAQLPFTAFGKVVHPQYDWKVVRVGWVFSRREHYEDARPIPGTNGRKFREQDYYTREVWVHVQNPPAAWGWEGDQP